MAKGPEAFRTISEAADELGVPQHVLRFWESRFSFIRPMKRAGGRRFYRPTDIVVLRGVQRLLHDEGYTIKGVQRLYREEGIRRVSGEGAAEPPPSATTPLEPVAVTAPPAPEPPASDHHAPISPPVMAEAAALAPAPAVDHDALRAALSTLEEAKAALDRVLAQP